MNQGGEPIIIAYHAGAGYATEARRLERSLAACGLDAYIHRLPSLAEPGEAGWQANTRHKVRFLTYWCLWGRPLLYLDADAYVHADPLPALRDLDCDLAVHYRADTELISATIWLRPGPAVLSVLKLWAEMNERPTPRLEQVNLQRALEQVPDCRVHRLGPEYCWMVDVSEKTYGRREPIIEQLQASRDFCRAGGRGWKGTRRERVEELERQQAIGSRQQVREKKCLGL